MRILIVDDDFLVLSGLRRLLADEHQVFTASDGETAASMVARVRPDVVLIDLLLSYENGLDLVEYFRSKNQEVCLVVMSAYPGREIIHESFAAGADGFLPKEDLGLVHEMLERLAELRRARRRCQ